MCFHGLLMNNYFIGGNFKNAVGIFVRGEKSLLLSIFESETKKNVKKPSEMYEFGAVAKKSHFTLFFLTFF